MRSGTTELLLTSFGSPSTVLRVDGARASGGSRLWSGTGLWVEDVGSEGRLLVGFEHGDPTVGSLAVVELDALGELSSNPASILEPLVASSGNQALASFSPDMTWVTYSTTESGPLEVHATRVGCV